MQTGYVTDHEFANFMRRPFEVPVPVLTNFSLARGHAVLAPDRMSTSHKEAVPSLQSVEHVYGADEASDESPIEHAKRGAVPTLFVGHVYTNGAVNVMGVQKMQNLAEDMFHNLLNNRDTSTVELLLRAFFFAHLSYGYQTLFMVVLCAALTLACCRQGVNSSGSLQNVTRLACLVSLLPCKLNCFCAERMLRAQRKALEEGDIFCAAAAILACMSAVA
jgi:hypothetical protein